MNVKIPVSVLNALIHPSDCKISFAVFTLSFKKWYNAIRSVCRSNKAGLCSIVCDIVFRTNKGLFLVECKIKLVWNNDEKFWYSESMNERFGLTLESDSLDVLIERVKVAVPDILEVAGFAGDIDLSFEIECMLKLKAEAT